LTAIEPVVLHLPGSMLKDKAKLKAFYGKIGDGLAARGARVEYLLHDRVQVPAQIEADSGFHIIDHGRIRHPRVLNAGLGYVRPWYYLDPWGMRAFSSVGEKVFDAGCIDAEKSRTFREELWRAQVLPRKSRYEQPAEVLEVPQGCIAVFLQTETHRDVGELCYLTMRHMVKALIARDDPRPIVIKTHPNDSDLDTLKWLVGKARKDARLRIIPANIHDILAACDVVVTINSAVGIEAMLHRKPVVLCGHADFHHCAVTLRDKAGMDAAITAALVRDWPYDAYLTWFFAQTLRATAPDLIDMVVARIAATGYDPSRIGLR
jgi:hypothetical protein